jgi:ATP-dependent Lon protease
LANNAKSYLLLMPICKQKPMFNRQNFAPSEEEMDFMPIVPLNEEEFSNEEIANLPEELNIIALKNMVLYPNVVMPITVSREKSIKALNEADNGKKIIGVLTQIDNKNEDPESGELYRVGTAAQIIKQIKLPDGSTTVFLRGRLRFEVNAFVQENPSFKALVKYLPELDTKIADEEYEAMVGNVRDLAEQIMRQSPNVPQEASIVLKNIDNVSFLQHFIASNLNCEITDKQNLLEENDVKKKTEALLKLLQTELQLVELKNKIHTNTHRLRQATTRIFFPTTIKKYKR